MVFTLPTIISYKPIQTWHGYPYYLSLFVGPLFDYQYVRTCASILMILSTGIRDLSQMKCCLHNSCLISYLQLYGLTLLNFVSHYNCNPLESMVTLYICLPCPYTKSLQHIHLCMFLLFLTNLHNNYSIAIEKNFPVHLSLPQDRYGTDDS